MFELEAYFSIQIFFIILRETLETAIIISVLLSFINQNNGPSTTPSPADTELQRKLKLQVWVGAISGLAICLFIGLVFITAFYYIGKDYWSLTERLWEGVFSLLSSAIITIMGLGLLRINKIMKVKWWMKLGDAYDSNKQIQRPSPDEDADADTPEDRVDQLVAGPARGRSGSPGLRKRYFLAILPFITTLREGLEAVVFVGGMGVSNPLTSLPLSIMSGIILGSAIGYLLYKGGNKLSLQYFLIISTCFLYTVSAGLMSRGVWFLELERFVRRCDGFDVSETGSGPGSYDISTSVWHVNCCNGLTDGWWMVFNAIFGWTNSATYGSVGSYIVYWLVVSLWLESKLFEERHGYLPLIPIRFQIKRIKKRIKLYRYIQESHAHQKDHDFDAPYEDLQSNPSVDLERLESHQLLHRA